MNFRGNKFLIASAFSVILVLTSFTVTQKHKYKVRTIVIDAGHGGIDGGCSGKVSLEKRITLNVVNKLGQLLKSNDPDLKIIFTRSTDQFVELHDRAGIANKNNADLFISVHCNSGPSTAMGSESYAMGLHVTDENLKVAQRENASILKEDNYNENYGGFNPNSTEAYILFSLYQNAFLDNSLKIANFVEHNFKSRAGRKSRGVKQAGFLVLWKTAMPSILVELGFLTNAEEEKFLNSASNQDSVAKDLMLAISQYKDEVEEN